MNSVCTVPFRSHCKLHGDRCVRGKTGDDEKDYGAIENVKYYVCIPSILYLSFWLAMANQIYHGPWLKLA